MTTDKKEMTMKGNKTTPPHATRKTFALWMTCLLGVWMCPSCSSLIDEDMSDCRYGCGLDFEYLIYDTDGGTANAFYNAVDRATIHVFNLEGKRLKTINATGDGLRRVDVDLPAGKYDLLVWAGLDGTSFSSPAEPATAADAPASLIYDGHTSAKELHPLWHGRRELTVTGAYETATVSVVKDTRRIRVVMQNIDGTPTTASDFNVQITDDNALIDSRNMPVQGHPVTYLPYATGQQELASTGRDGASGSVTAAYAEISTSRLVAGSTPRLIVTRADDGSTVLDIPLLSYLYLIKPAGGITAQEFLDRNDYYSLVFFLDNGHQWITTQIIINGWVVRPSSIDW